MSRPPTLAFRLAIGAAGAVALIAGCGPDTPPIGVPDEAVLDGYANLLLTTGDRTRLLSVEPRVAIDDVVTGGAPSDVTIDLDPSVRYQSIDGVGAAMTDSAAWVLTSLLDPVARQQVVNDLFGPNGAGMDVVRVPLSSSDFARDDYTYDDIAAPGVDPALAGFSLDREDAVLVPLLRAAKYVNPDLMLMGSPWTAPGWMKVNGSDDRHGVIGGTLRPDAVAVYARYLRRVTEAFADRGLPLDLLTLQNEPAYVPSDYAGMFLSADQESELAVALGAELRDTGSHTKLVVHDHNWGDVDRALDVLDDPEAEPFITGTAFHCYSGDPSAQSRLHDAYPDKAVYFTECSGTESSGKFESNLLWNARVLLVGATRNWSRTVLLWNLALDESSGPRVGGCRDCRGVLTIHPDGHVTKNEEFYALAQFGRGVDQGAIRIRSSESSGSISNVAFENPDGTRTVLVTSTAFDPTTVTVRDGDRTITTTLPPRSVATLRWR